MANLNEKEARPLNVERIAQICKELRREYDESALYTVWIKDPMEAHISAWGLLQIAPVSDWTWEDRPGEDTIPHFAFVMRYGVQFHAIFTDEERQAVIDGE